MKVGYQVLVDLQQQQAFKQWGTNTIGSRTTRTEAYPLPYSEFCLPIVSGKGYVGGLNYGFGVGVTNFGLTSVTIANNSEDSGYRWTGYTYIVVGAQQQWGIVYAEQGYIIVTLPLAYSSNKYVVIGQDLDYTSNDTDGYGENVGITQVTTTSIRVSITRGRYLSYCTIGF